jgi:hypothetical protein
VINLLVHFGLRIGNSTIGYKLTRENYVRISNKSTFVTGDIYDEDYCRSHAIDSLINFDYNMEFFKSLDTSEFNKEIDHFLTTNPQFKSVVDLNDYRNQRGFYLMVLDEYCQAYIGGSGDICKRIRDHWMNQKSFDRLIFGSVESSIISIDSFRPLDTTRLYVHVIDDSFTHEDRYIDSINPIFMCNRTIGGILEGGLPEAISNRKNREFKVNNTELSIEIKYAENLTPSPVQLHEIFIIVKNHRFSMNTDLDGQESNIVEWKYFGNYGMYTLVSNIDENLVTVTRIS